MQDLVELNASKLIKIWASIVIFLIILFNLPFITIKSSERWIVYRFWAVQTEALWEWLHLLIPFVDSVKRVSIIPWQLDIDIPVNEQWAITKDNQTIWSDITVFYKYKSSELVNIAKNYWYEVLQSKIKKDVNESFKQVIWSYTIFDVAQKQEEIRQLVISGAKLKIWDYPISIEDIKISNYDWSEEFDNQIAATMKIAQETKQQEQELKKIEVSSQQIVKQAEANKQAEALNAEALKLKWEGIRDYNQAITANPKNMELEIKLKELEIEKIRAEKRNGVSTPTQVWTATPVSFNPLQQ